VTARVGVGRRSLFALSAQVQRSLAAQATTISLVLRASFQASAVLATAMVTVAIIEAVLPVALAWTVRQLVVGLTAHALAEVRATVIAMGVIGACQVGTQWIAMTGQTVLEERTDHWLERELMAHVLAVPDLSAVESPEFQDQVFMVAGRNRHVVGSISTIIEAVAIVARLAGASVLLAFIAPALVPLPALVLFPVVASLRAEREVSATLDDISPFMRTARMLFLAATEPRSAGEVRQLGMTSGLADRQDEMLRIADRRQRLGRARMVGIMTVGWGLFAVGAIGLLWVSGHESSLHSSGVVFLLAVLAMQLVGQANQAAGTLSMLSRLSTSLGRFSWLRDFATSAQSRYRGTSPPPLTLRQGIELRHVSFQHSPDGPLILDDLSLFLPAGSVIALTGHNGAGKTTLVKLLMGLYQPTAGLILFDGVPLADHDHNKLRDSVAAGFQDFCRFELVVGDNVGAGDLPRQSDRAAVTAALIRAGSADVIRRLKDGLETPLGRSMSGGALPSEGQWQKLALGRTMMREAPILRVLDEPTANLDAESEAALFDSYLKVGRAAAASHGCITLLVSHRFATVRSADLIVTLRDGRIAEAGTHDELIAADGWYASVCAIQAAGYERTNDSSRDNETHVT
jgi:ATP-binding cassette, subfamily B, bacterial